MRVIHNIRINYVYGLEFLMVVLLVLFSYCNLSGDMYLDLLENNTGPGLRNIFEDNENYLEVQLIFQQDVIPLHYALPVRQYIDRTITNQWIERRDVVEWCARLPDLSPLDFFLWGHVEVKMSFPSRSTPTYCQRIFTKFFQKFYKICENGFYWLYNGAWRPLL